MNDAGLAPASFMMQCVQNTLSESVVRLSDRRMHRPRK
ncbi:MAG: hypothetical protein GAK41_00366 [Burkholderia gladioli]|nr:MAG: hypothetical protein GAK41_00366 [Burkholderia gladioli]